MSGDFEANFILVTLIICVWTALALLVDKRSYPSINRYFALFIFVLCISQAYIFTALIGSSWALLFGQLALATIWLKGPFLLIFVQKLQSGSYSKNTKVGYFFSFPLAFGISWYWPEWQYSIYFTGVVTALAFLSYSLYILVKRQEYLLLIYGQFKNTAVYWLIFIVFGLLALILVDVTLIAVSMYLQSLSLTTFKIVTFSISAYLLIIAVFSIWRPDVFSPANAQNQTLASNDIKERVEVYELEPAVRNLELSDSLALELSAKLDKLMEAELLYQRNDLSLMELAQHLDISVHQTSELLNVHKGVSFYAYVNGYRIRHSAGLLSDPDCQLRILDIAFESGFNNKNSFYGEFRSIYGVTPTQYRQQQLIPA